MPDETIIAIPHPEQLVVLDDPDVVLVVEEEHLEVVVTTPGPQGPPGPPDEFRYVHNQMVPASVWTIPHNLDGFPNVTVVDSANREVIGDLEWIDNNTVQASFASAFGGKAFVS